MKTLFKSLQNFFIKKKRIKFLSLKHREAEKHIELSVNEFKTASEQALKDSGSISNYLRHEKALFAKAWSGLTKLNRLFDSLMSKVVNERDAAQQSLDSYEKEQLSEHLKHEEQQYKAEVSQLIQQRRIELGSLQTHQNCTKQNLERISTNKSKLIEKLPHKIATDKYYFLWDILCITGMVLLLTGEGAGILSSLQILRNSVLMELGVTIALVISTLIFSKVIVYAFKRSSIFDESKEEKQDETWDLIFSTAMFFGVGIGLFVGHLRVQFLESSGIDLGWFTKVGLYTLGVLLFVANTFLYSLYSGENFTTKRLYRNQLILENRYSIIFDRINKKIAVLKSKYLNSYKALQHDYLIREEYFEVHKASKLRDALQYHTEIMNNVLSVSRSYKQQCIQSFMCILHKNRALIEDQTDEHNYAWPPINFDFIDPGYGFPFRNHTPCSKVSTVNNKNPLRMKNVLSSFIACILVLLSVSSCHENHYEFSRGEKHRVLHIIDYTVNGNTYILNSDQVLECAGIKKNPNNGIQYIGTYINDVSVSPEYRVNIETAHGLLTNTISRQELLDTSKKQLQTILEKLYLTKEKHYAQTNLFTPLRRYFSELSRENIPTSVLLQSDLLNNSSDFSVYQGFDPNTYTARVLSLIPDSLMFPLEIIVIHQPTRKDNELFQTAYLLFKNTLESKKPNNIRVSLKANL